MVPRPLRVTLSRQVDQVLRPALTYGAAFGPTIRESQCCRTCTWRRVHSETRSHCSTLGSMWAVRRSRRPELTENNLRYQRRGRDSNPPRPTRQQSAALEAFACAKHASSAAVVVPSVHSGSGCRPSIDDPGKSPEGDDPGKSPEGDDPGKSPAGDGERGTVSGGRTDRAARPRRDRRPRGVPLREERP